MKNLILLVTLFVGVLPFQSQIVNPIIIVEPDNVSSDVNNLKLVKANVSSLKSGAYLVKVQTPFGTAQRSIVIE